MKRAVPLLSVLVLALFGLGAVGCGGDDDDEPVPEAPVEAPEEEAPEGAPQGDASAGADLWDQAEPGCDACHTLAAADATGAAAPSLDEIQPEFERIVSALRAGPGSMPSYTDQFDDEQIDDLAAYVYEASRE